MTAAYGVDSEAYKPAENAEAIPLPFLGREAPMRVTALGS